jgi:hypothetical protein
MNTMGFELHTVTIVLVSTPFDRLLCHASLQNILNYACTFSKLRGRVEPIVCYALSL